MPNHSTLHAWKADLYTKVGVAAARFDHVANYYTRRAEPEDFSSTDLELIPQPLIKADRVLADLLKGCLGKYSELKRMTDHEEVHRWEMDAKSCLPHIF